MRKPLAFSCRGTVEERVAEIWISNLFSEEVERFSALEGDPGTGDEEAPDDDDGDRFFEAFRFVVVIEGPFAESALLEEAYELHVFHAIPVFASTQHRVFPDGGAAQSGFEVVEHFKKE